MEMQRCTEMHSLELMDFTYPSGNSVMPQLFNIWSSVFGLSVGCVDGERRTDTGWTICKIAE